MALIKVLDLSKNYENIKGKSVLKSLNMAINKSEIYGIMGMSGSGKSTLLKILGGLEGYDSGSIYIDSRKVLLNDKKISEQYLREKIGFIFQDFNLLEGLTVKENIMLPLLLAGNKADVREKIYSELVQNSDIRKFENKFIEEISGGQQQMTAIFRAVIKKPQIILADEPTGNLDPVSTKKILQLLLQLKKESKLTIVIVTHDFYVASFCDKVGLLNNGKIETEFDRKDMERTHFMSLLVKKTGAI